MDRTGCHIDSVQVYKETINKRMPGQAHSVAGDGFAIAAGWLQEEREDTFTRVTVSDVKPEILEQFQGEEAEHVCRQLAHLYHYYLHGPSGNTGSGMRADSVSH